MKRWIVEGNWGAPGEWVRRLFMSPIKPENQDLYPDNWKQISFDKREDAGWMCEGSPAHPDCRARHGHPHPVTGSRVVLTVAHLDHDPRNVDSENLRAWCQKCHLTYDAKHHAQNAARTRKEGRAMGDLFGDDSHDD